MIFFIPNIVAIVVLGFLVLRRGRDQRVGSIQSAQWLRIAGLIPLGLQFAIALIFGVGEMAGGDLSGAGHLVQMALAALFGIFAWMRPLEGGIALFIVGMITLISIPKSEVISAGVMIMAAPQVISGVLFTIAGLQARGATTPEGTRINDTNAVLDPLSLYSGTPQSLTMANMEYDMNEPESRHEIGCTVGIVHVTGGIIFFKNRDLHREYLINRLTVYKSTPDTYALKGVNLKTKALEGVSIGVNRHKICVANTHVESTDDVTYDVLCDRLLDQTRDRRDVPRIVNEFMRHNSVQGGRILVSSPGWTYLVEVFEKTFQVQDIEGSIAITNDFSLISHHADRSEIRRESSARRLETACRLVKDISNLGMLKSMLRSHIPEKGELSICNHQQDGGGTESSHIIQIHGDYVGWSSLVGYPCENDYNSVQLFP